MHGSETMSEGYCNKFRMPVREVDRLQLCKENSCMGCNEISSMKETRPKKIDVVEEMDRIERRESLGEAKTT